MAYGEFLDMKQAACTLARRDVTLPSDLTEAGRYLNDCYLTVCDTGDPWDFLSVEGQFIITGANDTYTFAGIAAALAVSAVTRVWALTNDTTGDPLRIMAWQSLERAAGSTQAPIQTTGEPQVVGLWDTRMRFFPLPDQAYTIGIQATVQPAAMVLDADVPLIPLSYRPDILVAGAVVKLLEGDSGSEALQAAGEQQRRYDTALARLRTAHGSARVPELTLTEPSFFDDYPEQGLVVRPGGYGVGW